MQSHTRSKVCQVRQVGTAHLGRKGVHSKVPELFGFFGLSVGLLVLALGSANWKPGLEPELAVQSCKAS